MKQRKYDSYRKRFQIPMIFQITPDQNNSHQENV